MKNKMKRIEFTLGTWGTIGTLFLLTGIGFTMGRLSAPVVKYCALLIPST